MHMYIIACEVRKGQNQEQYPTLSITSPAGFTLYHDAQHILEFSIWMYVIAFIYSVQICQYRTCGC